MLAKGALHVHSKLSHDGTLTVPDLAQFYQQRGYEFVCVSEHSQDMNEARILDLKALCARASTPQFCIIPGIEYSCSTGLHIVGAGCTALVDTTDPVKVVEEIHAQGGFAVLAHPKRIDWRCAEELISVLDAVEVWSIGYDGKFLPAPIAVKAVGVMQDANPAILLVAGHDLHRTEAFYDAAVIVKTDELSREAVLDSLRAGQYRIQSSLFVAEARMRFSYRHYLWLRALNFPLQIFRRARAVLQ